MTITGTGAYEAMRTQHRVLSDQLTRRAAAVSETVTAGRPDETAVTSLMAYLAEVILPHAEAEEQTIYPAAAMHEDLIGAVNEMLGEHATLAAAGRKLAGLAGDSAAAGHARHIAELFAAHAARANEVLLPALLADADVDLAALLRQMHQRAEEAAKAPKAGTGRGRDPQAALLGLLLEASAGLARTGQADLASQLAAAAWILLREDRPDLAVTATAALHDLARPAGAVVQDGSPGGYTPAAVRSAAVSGEPDLDVRDLLPARRVEAIFAAYRDTAPGAAFILMAGNDPQPLRYQLQAQYADAVTWHYLEAGPATWRVRVGRPSA